MSLLLQYLTRLFNVWKNAQVYSSNAVGENTTYFQKVILFKKINRISNTAMLLYAYSITYVEIWFDIGILPSDIIENFHD